MRKILIFLSIASLFGFASCNKEKKSGGQATLKVDVTEIAAPKDGSVENISIESNCYWDVEASDTTGRPVTWVKLSQTRGSGDCDIIVTLSANVSTSERIAIVTITTPSSSELTKTVTITQAKGEKPAFDGYSFPICQTFDVDDPEHHNLNNAVLAGNICMFNNGMVITWLKKDGKSEGANITWYCPSHTQPASGTEADRSIHRSIQFDGIKQLDTIQIQAPVKESISGDLRLMLGARAASFTAEGWEYYWSNDGESWNKILVKNAITPGSDGVWNVIYFTIPETSKVPAGGSLYIRFVPVTNTFSKTWIAISNSILICNAKAALTTLPAMDEDKVAFTHGFDDIAESAAAYVELPIGLMCTSTTGYASNYTSFGNQYILPDAYKDFATAKGCYARPGYLQVGYYDESLWTRQCIGTYTINIGERLKAMGVNSADAELTLSAGYFKDFRGYDPLAKVYVKCGADSVSLNMTIGKFTNNSVSLKKLDQTSKIIISCPRLTDSQLAALERGENVKNLQDYRFYIDDVMVKLTEIHSKGAVADGSYPDFNDGGIYKW